MPSLTLSVPEEMKHKMDLHPELNWSALAREAFAKRMKQLEILEKFEKDFSNSELTDKDCIELGRRLKQDMLKSKKEGKK